MDRTAQIDRDRKVISASIISLALACLTMDGCASGPCHRADETKRALHRNEMALSLTQHQYKPGERFRYFFEDTESIYPYSSSDGVPLASKLVKYQELQIGLTINIENDLSRRLVFDRAAYRDGGPSALNASPLRTLKEIVPRFPAGFSYAYKRDSEAIRTTQKFYAPYLTNQTGAFVYFKSLDIHTFQAMIDTIPSTLQAGQSLQKPTLTIPILGGLFYNAESIMHFQRIEEIDGIPCAYFKVVTMGNRYTYKGAGKEIRNITNYQYSFHVALSGPFQGLLYRGELQETAFDTTDSIIVQRQLSMRLLQ